jgi:hypothetical protein
MTVDIVDYSENCVFSVSAIQRKRVFLVMNFCSDSTHFNNNSHIDLVCIQIQGTENITPH